MTAHQCTQIWIRQCTKEKRFTNSKILHIKTHTKPMETYQYLHQTSCHPASVFCGFIKGTVISRIRTNSDPDNLKAALANFKTKQSEEGKGKKYKVEHKTKSPAQNEAKASELHTWRLELEIFPSRLRCGHPYRLY